MKTIINTAQPVVMTTNRQPLDVSLSINQRNGQPLTQAQDKIMGIWDPDRQGSDGPLVLEPIFKAYDPETGSFITVQPSVFTWKVNDVTVTTESTGADYYLEKTGANKNGNLVVRKNVDYDSPVKVTLIVSFTETSRAAEYREEATLMLTSENRPTEYYSVALDTPSVIEYRPFTDSSSQRTLTAVAYKGSKAVEFPYSNGIKYFWSYLKSGVWTAIATDGTYAPYVSGQGTDTLILDAEYIDHDTIKVMIATTPTYTAVASPSGNPKTLGYFEQSGSGPDYVYTPTEDTAVVSGKTYYALSSAATEPDCDSVAQCDIARVLPRIESMPYCKGGSAVEKGDTPRQFEAIVYADGSDMDTELRAEYIRLNWKSKPTNSNTVTDRGWGDAIAIDPSVLMQNGSVNVEVYNEIGILSPLDNLIDDSVNAASTDLLIDDSTGSSPSYNGYCTGRT